MKKIFIIGTLSTAILGYSQVIIGDNVGTATNKSSVLLEFAQGNKGIGLPVVRSLPTNAVAGTIVLDATSPTNARIKYLKNAATNDWVDLSGAGGNVTVFLNDQPTFAQVSEDASAKVVIGDNSTTADGVLVLESINKAMVLPQVEDVNDIPSPTPGMMVYVKKSGAKRLAVYNGTVWSFWKP